MPRPSDLILTAAHMRAAEEALIAAGTSVDELMQRAGQGAADWVWRISGGRAVTVLCGPGNNGGDGWVIAEALRQRGSDVAVVMAAEPATDAARTARALYKGQVLPPDAERHGEVLVDCLFGTGLTRPLSEDHLALLQRLAASHYKRIAVDLPSGVSSDDGALLSDGLPHNDLTIALGAWKQAHYVMPAAALMGALRRVDIGITPLRNDFTMPWVLRRPELTPPAADANKYSRGMVGIVVGDMPGAALLAAKAAMASGAGYVKLLSDGQAVAAPADLVVDDRPLGQAVTDHRLDAILVGPGLGRDARAQQRLNTVLQSCQHIAVILDADALHLYPQSEWSGPDSGTYDGSRHSLLSCFEMHSKAEPSRPQGLDPSDVALLRRQIVMTPHQGELDVLDQALKLPEHHPPYARKVHQAIELDWVTDAAVVAKGADTFIFHRDFGACLALPAPSWLSTAGTGDVLAGIIAARLASGANAFDAACEGVWLHGEAARLAGPAFSAGQLADCVRSAFSDCL